MSSNKCPGQDSIFMQARDVAEVKCPRCAQVVEFWPDELVRKCPACRHRFTNPENSLKCLQWCAYAKQCLAAIRGEDDSWIGPLREELIARMKGVFSDDEERIQHALAVLRLSEEIGRELGADPLVLVPAAILHDIGRAISRGGSGRRDHGEEGRRMASELLAEVGLPHAVLEEILELIEHHHDRGRMDTPAGSALFDADLIVNLKEGKDGSWEGILARDALTDAGRREGKEELTWVTGGAARKRER